MQLLFWTGEMWPTEKIMDFRTDSATVWLPITITMDVERTASKVKRQQDQLFGTRTRLCQSFLYWRTIF